MLKSNTRLFFTYTVVIILIFLSTALLILPLVEGSDRVVVLLTLIGVFFVFGVILYQLFLNYIKPLRAATSVMEQLVKGNYKIRAYENFSHDAGSLANSINQLARNLQDLNRQEKMQGRQLRTVIDNMESAVMLLDEKGYVHLVNRKFITLFGETESSYIGNLYYDVMKQEKVYQAVQEAFLYEQNVKDSITLGSLSERRYVEIVGAPIFTESKDLRGVVLVFHDITDLKRVEQMRKDFVANVSHELKTPITSIKGFAETMLDEQMDDPQIQNKFLRIIYNESDRLQALVHDLLELSKLEKEEMKLRMKKVQITHILDDIIAIIEAQANKKAIAFHVKIDQNIMIYVDPDRLKQVVANLLYNAINYTPNNGQVTLTVKEENGLVEISVEDDGMGIPSEMCDRIFERFYRVDKARSRNTGGTGLGLAIVKHIVEAHDGSIKVESIEEQGSKFTVFLPTRIE